MFAEGSKVMDGVFTQQLMLTLTHFMPNPTIEQPMALWLR